ncbi:hypothetical protein MNBD_GAMMA22-2707 [hydrothermal vent metagenome]|uniref:3-hydroxyisobutyrate dehydrogenase n=1 Tax=hydrothermal vent metagenome TaxID=652676 RepID=A0A3B0ZIC3_9ZZZZ
MKNIAVLGLGAMGARMAENFLKSGYKLKIWNRTADKGGSLVKLGAQQFSTPSEAVKNVDVVISMLTDDKASQSVWLETKTGALSGLHKDTVVIECSTVTPQWSIELSNNIRAMDAQFIEAPVIGSRPQAENSQLIHLIGGEKNILKKVQDVLSVNSSAIHYIGSVGHAMSMKLAVNGLFGVQVAALSEMLGTLSRVGIDKNSTLSLLSKLPITSPALIGIGLGMSEDNYTPLFPVDLVEKDFSYLLQLAKDQSASIPMANAALDVYQKAQSSGFGDNNISGVVKMYL